MKSVKLICTTSNLLILINFYNAVATLFPDQRHERPAHLGREVAARHQPQRAHAHQRPCDDVIGFGRGREEDESRSGDAAAVADRAGAADRLAGCQPDQQADQQQQPNSDHPVPEGPAKPSAASHDLTPFDLNADVDADDDDDDVVNDAKVGRRLSIGRTQPQAGRQQQDLQLGLRERRGLRKDILKVLQSGKSSKNSV